MKKEFLAIMTAVCFILLAHTACTTDKTGPAPTPTPYCGYVFGNNADNDNSGWAGEYLFVCPFTPVYGTSIKTISVKLASDTNYIAGIYSDNSGAPADLVTQTGIISGTAGWSTGTATEVSLNAGVTYWLVVITENIGVRLSTGTSSCRYALMLWSAVSAGLPADLNSAAWFDSTNEIKLYASGCR
jgi:hypothetical protein